MERVGGKVFRWKERGWRRRTKEKKYKPGNEREREDGGWKRDGTIDSVIFRKSRAFVDDSSSLSLFPIRKANNRVKKKEEKKKNEKKKRKWNVEEIRADVLFDAT